VREYPKNYINAAKVFSIELKKWVISLNLNFSIHNPLMANKLLQVAGLGISKADGETRELCAGNQIFALLSELQVIQ